MPTSKYNVEGADDAQPEAMTIASIMDKFADVLEYVDPRFTDLVTPRVFPGLMLRFPKDIASLKKGAGFIALSMSSSGADAIGFAGRRSVRILNAGSFSTSSLTLTYTQVSSSYPQVPTIDPRLAKSGYRGYLASAKSDKRYEHSFGLRQDGEIVMAEGNLFGEIDKETTSFVVLEIIAPGVIDGKFLHHKNVRPGNNQSAGVKATGYLASVAPISTVSGVLRNSAEHIYEGYSGKPLSAMQYGVGTVLQSSYASTAVQCSFMTKWMYNNETLVPSYVFGIPTPRIDFVDSRGIGSIGVTTAAGSQYNDSNPRIVCTPESDAFMAYEVIPTSGMLPHEVFISSLASNHRFAASVDPLTGKLVGVLPVGLDLGSAVQKAAQSQYAIATSVAGDYKIPEYNDTMSQEEKDAYEYSFPSTADISQGDETHLVNYNTHASRNALFRDLSAIESRVCSVAESAIRKGMFR